MSRYVIGIDGGGSKTAAVLLDERGTVLGRGAAGSSNYHHIGQDNVLETLLEAMGQAADTAGVPLSQISAACWALAGVDRPQEKERFTQLGKSLLPGVALRVENDAVAALVGGLGGHEGVVLIAGTGMVAYGEHGSGQSARAGGWGYLLDDGSAYGLALEALRAVALSHDRSDLPTSLTDCLLDALSLESPTYLIPWIYAPNRQVAEIAALAPLVLREAERGDLIAVEVATRGASALARAVESVARRLAIWESEFPLLLAGSLLTTRPFYRLLVTQTVQTRAPYATVAREPLADAASGAAFLALEQIGLPFPSREELEPACGSDVAASSVPWLSEQPNLLTGDLDRRATLDIVGLMNLDATQAVAAVRPTLPAIERVVEDVAARMREGGRLIYIGAGTSGRLGVLDAAECPPTFSTEPGQVVGLIAGGLDALTRSIEGAEDVEGDGAVALAEIGVGPLDSVVGIAASGRTPYVRGALREAKRRGALAVALVCNLPSPLATEADHLLAPLVGPELVTGSTRLKAGSAQKIVLNMLSTAVMVRLGKTYGNLMVDLRPVNAKLRARSRRIVAQACHISEDDADEILQRVDGDVKVAIVSTLRGAPPDEARTRLARANGVVRRALEEGS